MEKEDVQVLINKVTAFEKMFNELDKELNEALSLKEMAELNSAVEGFDSLRDQISDLQYVAVRLLEKRL